LKEVGLVIIQPVQIEAGRNVLKTIIADASGNGSIESTIALPECAKPQDFGSAITYFRRYALQSLLLLEAEDDDGNLASKEDRVVAAPITKSSDSRPKKDGLYPTAQPF